MKKIEKNKRLTIIISIICIIVIIGIIIGVNVIKVNIANGKYNSSNSGSNNKNLIPEYIKEGITLGGITGTLKVLDTSDATAKPEDIIKGKTAYVNGVKITGTKVRREMLKIGDYVEYTPDTASAYSLTSAVSGYTSNQSITQETMKWQIMSVNVDGTVDLISEQPTNTRIFFKGALGYNNVVFLLNDICAKQYSNEKYGVIARSIKLEDLESKLTETGLAARNSYAGYGTKYGNTYSPSKGRYYPKIYAYENGSAVNTTTIKTDGINGSDSYYNEPTTETIGNASSLKGTQTLGAITLNKNYFNNEEFFNLIFSSSSYYIATRCINCYSNANYVLGYKIYLINVYNNTASLTGWDLYTSHNDSSTWTTPLSIRPVVTINSNIEFTSGDGSIDNPYKISI